MLWIDGRESAGSEPLDRGLEFGDGLFETMAVVEGRVRLLERHLARLENGCHRLRILMPDTDVLRAEIRTAAALPETGLLKLVVTRGAGGSGYGARQEAVTRRYLIAAPARRAPITPGQSGARVARLPTPVGQQPRLAGLKHLNRLEQVLFRADVVGLGLDEGLVADMDGHLISGVMTNVFLILDGRLVTPSLQRCGIEGVMRAAVLEAAERMGLPTVIRDVPLAECDAASEVFLTNALIGVWPVTELDGRPLPIGAVTQQLQAESASW